MNVLLGFADGTTQNRTFGFCKGFHVRGPRFDIMHAKHDANAKEFTISGSMLGLTHLINRGQVYAFDRRTTRRAHV